MRYALLIAALAVASLVSPASATIWIAGDSGGQIGAYLKRIEAMRRSGERVVIDGPCLSACTMVLGSIARDRICVTPRAQLGFHAAYDLDKNGAQVTSRAGTSLVMAHYPQQIRNWIARHGGLSSQMIYLSGQELSSMYPSCDASGASASHTVGGMGPNIALVSRVRSDGRSRQLARGRLAGQKQLSRGNGWNP
jgi:hypothetical protein